MNLLKFFSISCIGLILLSFGFGQFLIEVSDWKRILFLNIVQMTVGLVSTYWLFKTSQRVAKENRLFWLFLSGGTFFSAFGTLVWIVLLPMTHSIQTPVISSTLWIGAYFFYFSALLFKLRKTSAVLARASYFFNLAIYMVAAGSISYYYLLHPLYYLQEQSFWLNAVTLLFQFADLGIFFCIVTLYYLIQLERNTHTLIFLVIGLLLQVIGDIFFVYLTIQGTYDAGEWVDLIWTLALLFIGFTGLYHVPDKLPHSFKPNRPFFKREFLFPYASIFLLSLLMFESYDWRFNALSLGWFTIFTFILVRQTIVLMKNNRLVKELENVAYKDRLTGLGNQSAFLQDQFNFKNHQNSVALILIHLNRFKVFMDAFGHQVGDQIIQTMSRRLSAVLPQGVHLFRTSENEFTILFPYEHEKEIHTYCDEIMIHVQSALKISHHEIHLIPRLGVSLYPRHSRDMEELQRLANEALYRSPRTNQPFYAFYDQTLSLRLLQHLEMENHLRNALQRNEFEVYYQPKVQLSTENIVGMEALIRWKHPEFGFISPAEFIPIAEESGLINQIGEWVLRTACAQNKTFQTMGFAPLLLSVNVSSLQFQNPLFTQMVEQVLQDTGLQAQWLELEITESIVQDIQESITILQELARLGVQTSIDDFGTGYSSLNVLEHLPIDTLKIDKSFVDRLNDDPSSPIVKTIIELGMNLNLSIVAEGIETAQQKMILQHYGCPIGQGYLFSPPVEAKTFIALLPNENPVFNTP